MTVMALSTNVELKDATVRDVLNMLACEVLVQDDLDMTNAKVTLPNQWVVSVQYGPGGYCENGLHIPGDSEREARAFLWPRPDLAPFTTTAEVAIFTPDDQWFDPHDESDPGDSMVWGHVSMLHLLRIVDAVGTYHLTGTCPCPNCVRGKFLDGKCR